MAKDDFKGYAQRFDKGGETLLDRTRESACPECNDGTKGLYRQVWRKSDRPKTALYAIAGQCPKGHKVERYGFGEMPPKDQTATIKIRGVS